jgi:hypothetical protein
MGRTFTERDSATSTHVAVVNQTFVKRFLDAKEPIGMRFGPDPSMAGEYDIVGVVDDSKYGDPSQQTRPMFFTPMAQATNFDAIAAAPSLKEQANKNEKFKHYASNLIVRYEGDPAAAAAEVRRALQQINPDITIRRLTTYDDQVSSYFTQERLVVRLTGHLRRAGAAAGVSGAVWSDSVWRCPAHSGDRAEDGAGSGPRQRDAAGAQRRGGTDGAGIAAGRSARADCWALPAIAALRGEGL